MSELLAYPKNRPLLSCKCERVDLSEQITTHIQVDQFKIIQT
jgi:hypothetical protein